jgi:hypothetical protein
MAHRADPLTYAAVVTWGYFPGITNGVLTPDDSVVRKIQGALRIAERSGDDMALAFARLVLGIALVHRHTATECDRGQTLLAEVSDVFLREEHNLGDRPLVNVYVARERARRGIATRRYRGCAPQPTTWSARDNCWRGALQRRAL